MAKPRRKPPEKIRSQLLGFLSDVYKLLTRLKRTRRREDAGMETPQPLVNRVRDMDRITEEMERALQSAPKHEEVGLEADKWARTLAALSRHRQLNSNALNNARNCQRFLLTYSCSLKQ